MQALDTMDTYPDDTVTALNPVDDTFMPGYMDWDAGWDVSTGTSSDNYQTLWRQDLYSAERVDSILDHSSSPLLEAGQEHTYDLRPGARFNSVAFCTWVDRDTSGTYDPSLPSVATPTGRRKPTSDGVQRSEEERYTARWLAELGKRQSRLAWLASQRNGCSIVVSFRFDGERAKAVLADLPDHWPGSNADDAGLLDERLKTTEGTNRSSKQSTSQDRIDRPNLTGHPEARGCWACYEVNHRCPLIDDFREWPCALCKEDNQDCELVTPSVRKRACESCKRKKTSCSYIDALDFSDPCVQCNQNGFKCIAGPTKDAIPLRISYDRDWVNDPPPKVPKSGPGPSACDRCWEVGFNCSLTKGDPMTPCIACDMLNVPCSASSEKIPSQRLVKPVQPVMEGYIPPLKRRRKPGLDHSEKKKATLIARPVDLVKSHISPDNAAVTKTISTKFCHPIAFNNDPLAGNEPCDFCSIPSYAFFGLGALKKVEVIDWSDNRPYTEMSNGYQGEGQQQTRICVGCTLSRLRQMSCPSHTLTPIPGAKYRPEAFMDCMQRLLSADNSDGKQVTTNEDQWCSICPALAMYECNTSGGFGICGMGFCETCAMALMDCEGNLQVFLDGLELGPTMERPIGLRADVELLMAGGPLARFIERQFAGGQGS